MARASTTKKRKRKARTLGTGTVKTVPRQKAGQGGGKKNE